MKVHLIDGTYELFRMFYGAPSAQDAEGREVGATRGLIRSLVAMLRQDDVTHVGIAFDHVIESFRNELFDGYKTGFGIDPKLWAQFPLAERVGRALGLAVWPMIDFSEVMPQNRSQSVSGGVFSPVSDPIASNSTRSPTAVPVPWPSIKFS